MKDKLKATILEFLVKKHCIGGVHTALDRVKSCVELHSKQDKKEFEQAVCELVKAELIFVMNKRTGKGSDVHVSVNLRKTKEIMSFLQDSFP